MKKTQLILSTCIALSISFFACGIIKVNEENIENENSDKTAQEEKLDFSQFNGQWNLSENEECELSTHLVDSDETIKGYQEGEPQITGLKISPIEADHNISVSYLFNNGMEHESFTTKNEEIIKKFPYYDEKCEAVTKYSSRMLNNVLTTLIAWDFQEHCPSEVSINSVTTMERKGEDLHYYRSVSGVTAEGLRYTQKLECLMSQTD